MTDQTGNPPNPSERLGVLIANLQTQHPDLREHVHTTRMAVLELVNIFKGAFDGGQERRQRARVDGGGDELASEGNEKPNAVGDGQEHAAG